jgi:leucyl aminopeptidase (aminopeptidase T)
MPSYNDLASRVLSSTLAIQPGDDVVVETWDHGLQIADTFVYRLRELGARPMLLLEREGVFWRSLEKLTEDKLGKVGEHEWAAIEKAKGYVFIPGPADIRKIRRNRSKFGAATAYNEQWYERAKRYRLKAARIGLGYATQHRARAYKFSLSAWRKMLLAASTVDFTVLRSRLSKLAPLLRVGNAKITAPNGTNLTLRLAGREPYVEDCVVDEDDLTQGRNVANIPGGNALVCPDESYAEGTVVFDRPTAYLGRWIGGIQFEFKNGELIKYRARKNADALRTSYEKATGERNRIAAIGVGVNPKARTGFLQDGIVAGAVTVAIGGNDDLGGANKTDFYFPGILSKATLTVNDNVIVKNGELTLSNP